MRFKLFVSVGFGLFGRLVVNLLYMLGIARRISLIEKNAERLATGDPIIRVPPAKDEISVHVSLKKSADVLARKAGA